MLLPGSKETMMKMMFQYQVKLSNCKIPFLLPPFPPFTVQIITWDYPTINQFYPKGNMGTLINKLEVFPGPFPPTCKIFLDMYSDLDKQMCGWPGQKVDSVE